MKPDPFYMIVNVGEQEELPPCQISRQRAPVYCHATLAEAEKECLRLASLHHGTFVILKSVAFADWNQTLQPSVEVMAGLRDWALRMGLSTRVQVAFIKPMDDPEIPY